MNYGELKSHFEALLNRSDNTSALTETFISQGISRIGRQLRTAMNEQLQTYALTAQTAKFTLPSDFLEIISLYYGDRQLIRLPMAKFRPFTTSAATGSPKYFTREQATILLHPQPTDGSLVLYYYGDFPTLTADTDTNALSIAAPDLIIYAALTYAADFYLDERAEIFESKYTAFLAEIQEQANDQELNGSANTIAPAYAYGDD